MDPASATVAQSDDVVDYEATIQTAADVRLFNDVFFAPPTSNGPQDTPWLPFPRLPPELRLHVWWLFLHKHRMIELQIRGGRRSRYSNPYTNRNHLNKIVSGRDYRLAIRGRGYAASLSPLLWVSSEARQAALRYYRVHLRCIGRNGDRVLYFNPEHDVLDLGGSYHPHLLPDFLHDVRAYDPRDRGVAHLAIRESAFEHYPEEDGRLPPLNPAKLHPAAAAAFADALRSTLRSVLCVVRFRSCMRGTGGLPPNAAPYHFSQTLPLCRRGIPVGAFSWLETDPRWGVEFDLETLILGTDAQRVAQNWEKLEKAFGIHSRPRNDEFRFYICPTLHWPQRRGGVERVGHQERLLENYRRELAQHLREEWADWRRIREHVWHILKKYRPSRRLIPREGLSVDSESFKRMEETPSTTIGLWLFTPEAFKERIFPYRPYYTFKVAPLLPGLFLFEV